MNERKSAILGAVIDEYTETAQPVGSTAVAAAAQVTVSAATVRNEMVTLEREGYLCQPHTSAGRIPTEKGYRFFVDNLDSTALSVTQRHQVSQFFGHLKGEIEQVLQDTAGLLATITNQTAVVVDGSDDSATVVAVQLVRLSELAVMAVVVLDNGQVTKQTMACDALVSDDAILEVNLLISTALEGHTLGNPTSLNPTGDELVDALAVQIFSSLTAPDIDGGRVYVEGASRVASSFEAVDSISQVLTILEKQLVVVGLLADVIDRGLTVAIGTETGVGPLSECSLVVSPYEIDGEHAGSIAVLGPTRMNYPQAMSAVSVVSSQLGDRLSEG